MRISTSQLYNMNVAKVGDLQSSLAKTQQQISSGTRVLSPSDDPIASARALQVKSAKAALSVEAANQGTAADSLKTLDSSLSSITDVLQYIRDRALEAGNGSLTTSDLQSIASDVQSQFSSLVSIANSKDAYGTYMYSGYKGETLPFSGDIQDIQYNGDQGERTLQVSSSRLIPVSLNGNELFMNIPSANGVFSVNGSSSTAIIGEGTVTGNVAYSGTQYGIKFTSATTYDVYDIGADPTMTATTTPPLLSSGVSYTSGTAITLPDPNNAATSEISVTISGTPSAGDSFTAKPGDSTDMFSTIQEFVVGLTNTSGTSFTQMISDTIARLDNALANVSRLQSDVGSREVEVEALTSLNSGTSVQYDSRISDLVGLDYASAISTYQEQQTSLQAALNTFSKISGLSLFNYISG